MNFHFFAYAALGKGLSGGDRIFIELARRWSKKFPITIYLWQEGYEICKTQKLDKSSIKFKISLMEPWWRMGFVVNYFARIIQGVVTGLKLQLSNNSKTIVYSASEFWMDSFPAYILKLRFPKVTWVAAWYQTAPNPLQGFALTNRKDKYRFNAFLYWFMQLPVKIIISRFADFVIVNNDDERKKFPVLDKKNKVVVCLGAVDLERIKNYQKKSQATKKIYDGIFQGRLHPQKGVLELVDIWKKVVVKKPKAKLAIIGDGPLMKNLKTKINNLKLNKNIKVFGYIFDGTSKYKIFSQSKVVLHPAFYDSGGMAAAEAMAFGLPAVGFDLPAYKSYYPSGMVKVKTGDLGEFVKSIRKLLTNKTYYKKLSISALETINKSWSWDKRAKEVLSKINEF